MRPVLLLALAALLALPACDTSPIGGRCVAPSDCDRSTVPTAQCVNLNNPGQMCRNTGDSCICCPISGDSGIAACNGIATGDAMVVDTGTDGAHDAAADATDAGPQDATDASEAGDATDATDASCPATCPVGTYCPTGGAACAPLEEIGQPCGNDAQCGTHHCVSGVCCNSACSEPGHSCNADPDFVGVCMPVATTDAGPG